MQAKLPDINAALAKARMDAIIAYDTKNYNKCVASLECMVALLPTEYQVQMTNEAYAEAVKNNEVWKCRHCGVETPRVDIKDTTVVVPAELRALVPSARFARAWVCPSAACGELSITAGTIRIQNEMRGLYFLKCVPEPPRRTPLMSNMEYRRKFTMWFRITRREIEFQIGKYRADYVSVYDEGEEGGGSSTLDDDESLSGGGIA